MNTAISATRHGRAFLFEALVVVAVASVAAAVIAAVYISMDRVRAGLPVQVLAQAGEVSRLSRQFHDLARFVEAIQANGADEPSRARLLKMIHRVRTSLQEMRQGYNFDNLIGASALHAVLNPALQDMGRWLDKGASGFPPGSKQVIELIHLRAEGAAGQLPGVLERTNAAAQRRLREQSDGMRVLRNGLFAYLAFFAIFAAAAAILFLRARVARQRASENHQRLVDSIESVAEGYALYDRGGRMLLCNSRFEQLRSTLPPGVERHILDTEPPPDTLGDSDVGSSAREVETTDGRTLRISTRTTGDGGTVTLYTDISSLKRVQKRLEHLATHDPLTGLLNRGYLDPCLIQGLARAKRGGLQLAVMFLDLDHFKRVNDTLGHAAGDELLRRLAAVLKHCVRQDDVLVRFGGDEFAAVLGPIETRAEVVTIAERIFTTLTEPFLLGGNPIEVGMSVGIAMYPEHGSDAPTLLSHADSACYEAKDSGRNAYRFYRPAKVAELPSNAKTAS